MLGKYISKIIHKMYFYGPHKKNNISLAKNIKYKNYNRIDFEKEAINNEVIIEDGAILNNVRIRFTGKNSKLHIGPNVKWKGYILVHGDNRSVTIGEGTTCIDVYIMCRDANISIGKYCMLSRGIEIRSSDVHKIYHQADKQINMPMDVNIKDRVWVAADCTISKGATIYNDTVVGAKSFVNKSFSEEKIVIAGVPAKIVRTNVTWQR